MFLAITPPPGVSRKLARLSSSEDEGMSHFNSILSHGVSFSYLETISIHSSVEKEEISTKQISSEKTECLSFPFT